MLPPPQKRRDQFRDPKLFLLTVAAASLLTCARNPQPQAAFNHAMLIFRQGYM